MIEFVKNLLATYILFVAIWLCLFFGLILAVLFFDILTGKVCVQTFPLLFSAC